MSKGTKIITLRLPSILEDAIDAAIAQRNEVTKQEPWTRTAFFLTAIREKLSHMERSRKSSRKRQTKTIAEK